MQSERIPKSLIMRVGLLESLVAHSWLRYASDSHCWAYRRQWRWSVGACYKPARVARVLVFTSLVPSSHECSARVTRRFTGFIDTHCENFVARTVSFRLLAHSVWNRRKVEKIPRRGRRNQIAYRTCVPFTISDQRSISDFEMPRILPR